MPTMEEEVAALEAELFAEQSLQDEVDALERELFTDNEIDAELARVEKELAATSSPEPDNFLTNMAAGFGERAAELGGNLLQTGEDVRELLASKFGEVVIGGDEGFIKYYSPEDVASGKLDKYRTPLLARGAEEAKDLDLGFTPTSSAKAIKEAKGFMDTTEEVVKFALEQGSISLADMGALIATSPAYLLSRTTELSYERADNQGRKKPNEEDRLIGSATAIASFAMDRLGLSTLQATNLAGNLATRIAEKVSVEAGTETIQEIGEYIGTHLGTKKGATSEEAAEAGFSGALGALGPGSVVAVAEEVANRDRTPKMKSAMDKLAEADRANEEFLVRLEDDLKAADPTLTTPEEDAAAGLLDVEEELQPTGIMNEDGTYPVDTPLEELQGDVPTVEQEESVAAEPEVIAEPEVAVEPEVEPTVVEKVQQAEKALKQETLATEQETAMADVRAAVRETNKAEEAVARQPENVEAQERLIDSRERLAKARAKQRKAERKIELEEVKEEAATVKEQSERFIQEQQLQVLDNVKIKGDKSTYEVAEFNTETGKAIIQKTKEVRDADGNIDYEVIEGSQKEVDILSLKKQGDVTRKSKEKALTKKEEASLQEQLDLNKLMPVPKAEPEVVEEVVTEGPVQPSPETSPVTPTDDITPKIEEPVEAPVEFEQKVEEVDKYAELVKEYGELEYESESRKFFDELGYEADLTLNQKKAWFDAHPDVARPTRKASKTKPKKALSDIALDEKTQVTDEEGNVYEVDLNAQEAFDEIVERKNKVDELRVCINA